MNQTAILADHIDQQIDAILSVWKSTVERYGNVPDSARLTHREFVDHIPELLDRLVERLRGQESETTSASHKHGNHRWKQGYEIAEVVSELGHLRTTLIRDAFAFGVDHRQDVRWIESTVAAINEVMDEAMAESVREFEQDSKEVSLVMIAEFEQRRIAAESEQIKLQTLLNNLPMGVWVCGADGTIVGLNREAQKLQGFSDIETVGQINIFGNLPEYRIYHVDGTEYSNEQLPISRALRGESVYQEDVIWPTRSETRVVSINAAPLNTPEGKITGAVVVVQDVTDRKRLEADLALSEVRLRGIVEKSPVMIWQADPTGNRDFFNETWLQFRGRGLDREINQGWLEGVDPDDLSRVSNLYCQAFEARTPFEIVYRLRQSDGAYRSVIDRGSPFQDNQGNFLGYLGSCLDITARVELEAKLEQQSQHKSRLMSALSHDARTPLNAVVLSAKLLESQANAQDDPEFQDCLRTIRNSVRNVLDLLSDLLDLTRIDAGATLVETSRFSIKETLAECLSSIEPQAQAKGLKVLMDAGSLDDARLETDRTKLKQILSNLLSNALRYTQRGQIRLFATIQDSRILIGVQDTGVGIPRSDQERIFDEFAVLEHPDRVRGEGTGLGLAICRRLVNLLQGEILLESTPGLGSRFTISMPISILTNESVRLSPPKVEPSRDFAGAILIAEDHVDSRKTLAKVLRRMGYRVLEAGDGHEVLELIQNERPMVVLMDVNMPGLNGVETTLQLRKNPETREIPIFALTGDVTILNQQRIGEAGVDGYLEKPVTWEKLEAALAMLKS